MAHINTDVLIVGAGPVGAHAARLLGEVGLDVVVVEKNARDGCGAQWVNGVPQWQLDDAGIGVPSPGEIFFQGGSFTMVSPLGNSRLTLPDAEMLDLDMRRFGVRLLERAEQQKSVRVFYDTAFKGLDFDAAGRPVGAYTDAGSIRFRLIIDASGLSAMVRKQVPLLAKLCAPVAVTDLCTAAQEVHEIADVQGAQTFLERNKCRPGEALAFVNIAGGFSLLRVHVDYDMRHVAFLTGSRPLPGIPSGKELIRNFINDNAWVGQMIFGGQRPVPLRRPYAALSSAGVALLGDSACQVYSAHGSGIGISLLAARVLAENVTSSLKAGEDIGAADVLLRYADAFHRKYGALLINSDISRRFSQELSKAETHVLIERRLLTHQMVRDSLFQRPVGFRVADFPSQIAGAVRHPMLVGRVLRVAAKIPAVAAMMRVYPGKKMQPEKLLKFENRIERLINA